jgi:hypothetical protein
MSRYPSFEVFLKNELTEQQRNNVLDKLTKSPGVLSAHFNMDKREISFQCYYEIPKNVDDLRKKTQKIAGVKDVWFHGSIIIS